MQAFTAFVFTVLIGSSAAHAYEACGRVLKITENPSPSQTQTFVQLDSGRRIDLPDGNDPTIRLVIAAFTTSSRICFVVDEVNNKFSASIEKTY